MVKTKTNPAFYEEDLRLLLADEPGRFERVLEDSDSLDLLTWNVFASLETHTDRDWLAYRLQAFGGTDVRAPVRLSLWTGRYREPLLRPSSGYIETVRGRARRAGGSDEAVAAFTEPVEVPVRIESPDVLVLVDTVLDSYHRGAGGRDRLAELIDAGIDHARRLSKSLAVAVVYKSGTQAAADLSHRLNALRNPDRLAQELAHRERIPEVLLREVPWQQLLRIWEQELDWLELSGEPVREFLRVAARRNLR